ncbi:mannose-1-phosphate guanylyltransferase/mannose-6-phosphate isomerase [Halomonas sp. THAF12]|uniref:mannose-1-phosphate guanylyltransferase/mannose-6-phosphate isomerase n=1 Tax=Halomonas sp. B23F22_10 TaxID=3459515 RepID=UPI00373F0428
MLRPVILSGGSGSRLWPVSREHYPKQFLKLNSERHSLLQETVLRLGGIDGCASPLVVCNDEHRFLVAEQLQTAGVPATTILLEPLGRNTAPALALACMTALEDDDDASLLVMPADHVIEDHVAFAEAVAKGRELVAQGQLVTFGIEPSSPHTGYGYIRRGTALGSGFQVDVFVEKPDIERARAYLVSGDYLWNSGIFLVGARHYLQELSEHAPDILEHCQAAYDGRREDMDFLRIDPRPFTECRSESIDYAVMEHTRTAAVVPMDPGWSDIGSWDAIHDLKRRGAGEDGNAVHGDVLLHDSTGNLVRSESRLVAGVGVKDLVIVETADAVLVANREHAQETKQIVSALKAAGRAEFQSHQSVYRPWGHYRALVSCEGFQVKEIVVKPGGRLSLQMHHHRAEHWVVVAGTARVTLGGGHGDSESMRSFLLSEDESTYIPLGTLHRLENPGLIPLRLIEVQTGVYLGEDDIVRFDDIYGRTPTGVSHEG